MYHIKLDAGIKFVIKALVAWVQLLPDLVKSGNGKSILSTATGRVKMKDSKKTMSTLIKSFSNGSCYWWVLLVSGFVFEAVALFYQYVLDYGPCPLCIHVRIGVFAYMLVSVLALMINNLAWRRFSYVLNMAILAWLSERAYLLLGTERGFVFIECGVDSGLPSWLALDQWFPAIFGVMESCGYTPKLLWGVSMAEALMVLFPLLLLITLGLFVGSFFARSEKRFT